LKKSVCASKTLRARSNGLLGYGLHLPVDGGMNTQPAGCQLPLSNSIYEFLADCRE
jgi:hypothetical protein